MSEAWEWYLKQKEDAKARYEANISNVNRCENVPQSILYIKLCGDALNKKDEGKPLFSEPHVNQLMHLAYDIGVMNAKDANANNRKAVIEEIKECIIEALNNG